MRRREVSPKVGFLAEPSYCHCRPSRGIRVRHVWSVPSRGAPASGCCGPSRAQNPLSRKRH